MADWTSIPDVTFDTDRPVLGSTHLAIVKNFEAMAEGASGAPRVEDAALDTTVTSAGRDWVSARIVSAAEGAVGTYVVAWNTTTTVVARGGTIAGSNLRCQNANETNNVGGRPGAPFRQKTSSTTTFPTANTTTLAGTWRALIHGGGRVTVDLGQDGFSYRWMPSFWLRIS